MAEPPLNLSSSKTSSPSFSLGQQQQTSSHTATYHFHSNTMEKLPTYSHELPDTTVSAVSSQPGKEESFGSRLIAGLKRILATVWLCFAVYLFANVFFPGVNFSHLDVVSWPSFRCHGSAPGNVADSHKVSLDTHVMSKCPDARDCLRQLVVPAMEQVSDMVDFDLSFIAR